MRSSALHDANTLSLHHELPPANCRGHWFIGGAQVSGVCDDHYGPACNLANKTDTTGSHGIDHCARPNSQVDASMAREPVMGRWLVGVNNAMGSGHGPPPLPAGPSHTGCGQAKGQNQTGNQDGAG
jgi:hypothetical protein